MSKTGERGRPHEIWGALDTVGNSGLSAGGVLFPVMIGTLFQQVLAACYGALLRRFQLRFTFYAAVFTK
ncbi:MAG: hypothetical protein SOX72_07440, partial [Oscillospiraceae bacterium]|nr:hypothetical protein [Oscillospiraceae bacterium]